MAEYLAELLMNTLPPVGLDTIATRLPVVPLGLAGVQTHQLKNLGCRTIVSGQLPQVVDRFREHPESPTGVTRLPALALGANGIHKKDESPPDPTTWPVEFMGLAIAGRPVAMRATL